MATASMLWIQEEFEAGSETYEKVVEIATKWNASVELVRLAQETASTDEGEPPSDEVDQIASITDSREFNGGIEDDEQEDERPKAKSKKKSKSKANTPAPRRAQRIAAQNKSKPLVTILFVILCVIGFFAGLAIKHYLENKTFLLNDILNKDAPAAPAAPE